MTQSTIRVDGANMVEVKTVDDNHSISWKVGVKGSFEFCAKAHNVGEYLLLSVEEMPYGVNAKNRSTLISLEKPAAESLRTMLNDTFGPKEIEPVKNAMKNRLYTAAFSYGSVLNEPALNEVCSAARNWMRENGWADPKANEETAAKVKALEFLRDELRTHIDSFRKGLEEAAKLDSNPDNRAYWKHEVKALGDIEAALKKTLQ